MRRITSSWRGTLLRACCFGLGAAAVAVALSGWQIPRGTGFAGTDAIFAAQPTGELAVEPTGAFVTATGLVPGSRASGGFGIANQTGRALRIRLRALPDSLDLDDVLHVEINAEGNLLYRGQLGGLRHWTARAFVLRSGRKGSISARVWIPESVETGYQGQSANVPVELRVSPVEVSR